MFFSSWYFGVWHRKIPANLSALFVARVFVLVSVCSHHAIGASPTMEMDLICFFFSASFCQRSASVCLGFNLPFWMHILECCFRIHKI